MNNTIYNEPRTETVDFDAALEREVAEIIKRMDGESYEWLLITHQHDFPLEVALHDTREVLVGDLGNALTCHYSTLGIFHRGRRLALDEIRALEKEGMEGLGPISRARAEGKF